MFEVDTAKLYIGQDIQVNNRITIKQPTVDQIIQFGERDYWAAIHNLCASPADLKWQLWEKGIDYTTISDYDLFFDLTSPVLGSRTRLFQAVLEEAKEREDIQVPTFTEEERAAFAKNPLALLIYSNDGEPLDLGTFDRYTVSGTEDKVLYNKDLDITIDKLVFREVVDVVRKIHFLKRNDEMPGNNSTKMILIEDAKDEWEMNKDKPFSSTIVPLLSAISVKCGQVGDDRIRHIPIYQFLENVRRMFRIQDASLLLQGAYSGFASLKDVDKDRLDWASELKR